MPSGFIVGINPSITNTNAKAAKRSEKLISSNQFHHYHFNPDRRELKWLTSTCIELVAFRIIKVFKEI
jgi:hypothetical protein